MFYLDFTDKGKRKGKWIYIAYSLSRRSGTDHTVLCAVTPIPAFTS